MRMIGRVALRAAFPLDYVETKRRQWDDLWDGEWDRMMHI